MRSIIAKINCRIGNYKMRPIRPISSAIYYFYIRVCNGCNEGARKTGSIVIRDKCRIFDIDVVSAVTTIPFQCIMGIILDNEFGIVNYI